MKKLCGSLEALTWESQFFGITSAMLRVRDDAPCLCEDDMRAWQLVQVKIPAARTDWLDALQQMRFRLVEGEIDLSIEISQHMAVGAEIATEKDVAELRQLAASIFKQSRFRPPWYSISASSRFYAQWIENAVKGTFDHQCLIFRVAAKGIKAFVSLRRLNEWEGRIGLLAGHGMGGLLIQGALHWAQVHKLSVLRVATQMGNTSALRSYITSGANVETTAYWLYR